MEFLLGLDGLGCWWVGVYMGGWTICVVCMSWGYGGMGGWVRVGWWLRECWGQVLGVGVGEGVGISWWFEGA